MLLTITNLVKACPVHAPRLAARLAFAVAIHLGWSAQQGLVLEPSVETPERKQYVRAGQILRSSARASVA